MLFFTGSKLEHGRLRWPDSSPYRSLWGSPQISAVFIEPGSHRICQRSLWEHTSSKCCSFQVRWWLYCVFCSINVGTLGKHGSKVYLCFSLGYKMTRRPKSLSFINMGEIKQHTNPHSKVCWSICLSTKDFKGNSGCFCTKCGTSKCTLNCLSDQVFKIIVLVPWSKPYWKSVPKLKRRAQQGGPQSLENLERFSMGSLSGSFLCLHQSHPALRGSLLL